MKAALVTLLLLGAIISATCFVNPGPRYPTNNYPVNNGYSAGYGLNNYGSNYASGYSSCRPLGAQSSNIADCCSQSSAPIDRSNLNKCCLAQGQFCNGHQDKCCYANGQLDCVPTGNAQLGIRTCQLRPSGSNY